MDNRGALVSIIVPVYNAEAWLSRCIESILAQTYKNFELICVDDGSTDSSGAICDEYARNDTRIRVVHRPNSGVSAARNAGLDLAAGEYIMFVDSDDWIEPEHVQLLLPNGSEDWVYGGYKAFLGETITDERGYPEQMIYRKDWMENFEMFWSTMLLFSASCSCYSSDIIKKNRLRFDADVHMSEDELFNLKYIQQCSSIRFTGKSTYHYRQSQSGSLMNSYHPNRLQDCMRIGQLVETVGETKMYHYRWIRWHMALAHYKKWLLRGPRENRWKTYRKLFTSYFIPYFRECIPYMRKTGTLDEKIETFFMLPILHSVYKPLYTCVIVLSKLKNTVGK